MAGFLTDDQKTEIRAIFDQVHDTFARTITVFKIGQRVTIASSPTYNALYKQQSANTSTTEVSSTFSARINYVAMDGTLLRDSSSDSDFAAGQDKAILPTGSVLIKVGADGYAYIREAKRVEFDGRRFSIKSHGKPIGMFGPQYYEFLLIPMDS